MTLNIKNQEKKFKYYIPLLFGLFIILSTIVFIIMGSSAYFYDIKPNSSREWLYSVFGGAFYLVYFTIHTNLFLGIMLIFYTFYRKSKKTQSLLFSSVNLITLTFLLYWSAIAPKNGHYEWTNVYLMFDSIITHVVNPLIGFIFIIVNRKSLYIEKKYVGWTSLYVAIFLISNDILYASTATKDPYQYYPNGIKGVCIYSFIDVQHVLFTNLSDHKALLWILNVVIVIVCPFLSILTSYLWLKALKIATDDQSYYVWMQRIKWFYRKKTKKKSDITYLK